MRRALDVLRVRERGGEHVGRRRGLGQGLVEGEGVKVVHGVENGGTRWKLRRRSSGHGRGGDRRGLL